MRPKKFFRPIDRAHEWQAKYGKFKTTATQYILSEYAVAEIKAYLAGWNTACRVLGEQRAIREKGNKNELLKTRVSHR